MPTSVAQASAGATAGMLAAVATKPQQPQPGALVAEPLGALLERLASAAPTPGAGLAAALSAAMAASLLAMAAGRSPGAAADAGARALILRERLLELAEENDRAHAGALAALEARAGD